jgi:type I restriction enzyme S subunit
MINNVTKFKETEIGTIPEEWDVLELDKFAMLAKDAYLPNKEEDLFYVGLEHIDQQTLSLNSVGKSTDVTSNKYRFKDGDILFGKLRPYFRKVYRPKFSGICSTDIWVARAKEGFDQGWLFYLFASEDFVNHASGGSGGTRMPRADWGHVKDTTWPVPKLSEQKQIAEILSSLDDKIELNRKINANLEKLASSLFKQWFVDIDDELPEGWVTGKLSDVADITIGRTPPRMQKQWFSEDQKDVKWISIRDLGNSGIYVNNTAEYLTREAVERFNIPIILKNTVILSFKLTVGRVAITTEDMLSNEAIAHFKLKEKKLSVEYVYFALKKFDYSSLGSTSSIAMAVNSKTIKDMPILIPDEQTIKKFTELVAPMFAGILENTNQIDSLSQIRDSFLPRLMSGKIRVNV